MVKVFQNSHLVRRDSPNTFSNREVPSIESDLQEKSFIDVYT